MDHTTAKTKILSKQALKSAPKTSLFKEGSTLCIASSKEHRFITALKSKIGTGLKQLELGLGLVLD
jgi:hypothetical protein